MVVFKLATGDCSMPYPALATKMHVLGSIRASNAGTDRFIKVEARFSVRFKTELSYRS